MAVNLTAKIIELLKMAGIDYSKIAGKIDPNKVKQLVTKTQKTGTKPKLIDALVTEKATFSDALKIFEDEAQYISQMNEMELANFANNLDDYFKAGGKKKNIPSNVVTTEGTPVSGKKLETLSERKGAKGEADTGSLQGSMQGLASLIDEIKGISPKMRNQMDRDELAKFIQKMRGRKFTNEEIKWVKAEMDEWGIGIAKEKATGMQYGKKLGAKSKEEFEFVKEYVDNLNSYSPKEFKANYGTVKNVNMDISNIIDSKLEKHFKKKYKWDKSKGRDGGLDEATLEKYDDELWDAQKEFGDFHTVYDSGPTNMWGQRKGKSWANHPNNYLDEASEKFESITGEGLNVDFFKKYTDEVLSKYPEPEKFQYGGPVVKGPDMGSTAHGSAELASRQRMLQPGGQMTTSTGLNYLLGEDDNTRIPFQEGGGIESRLEQLGGDVTSAEQMLQQINERLESAGSSIPEGGGDPNSNAGGLGTLAPGVPTGLNRVPEGSPTILQPDNPLLRPGSAAQPINFSGSVTPLEAAPFMGRPALHEMPGYQGIQPVAMQAPLGGNNNGFNFRQEGDMGRYIADNDPGMQFEGYSSYQDYLGAGNDPVSRPQGLQPLQSASSQENLSKALPGLFAQGGRAGFAGGGMGRRGFLKFLGGTAAGIAAMKSGLVKLLGGKSAPQVKKVIDNVVINSQSGAPEWFQPLVNKILKEGKDANITYGERQIGKTMDTPSGNVDVVYKMDTGDVELSFVGKNTALGEQVDLVYKPGQVIEEGKFAGKKEGDEFIASESVPEGIQTGKDDYSIELGVNESSNVGDLASDLSELKTFATGEKQTIKEIVDGIKKKKTRAKMEKDQGIDYITETQGDYPYASGGIAGMLGE